jgi:hypothetical protein
MERQIQLIRNKLSVLITHLTEERFEILENKNDLKHDFMLENECFDLLVVVTTREKIHRYADQIMRQLKRLDTDIDMTRLRRLVRIHITQMKKMRTQNIEIQITFYNDMLTSIEHTHRFLKLLLTHNNK